MATPSAPTTADKSARNAADCSAVGSSLWKRVDDVLNVHGGQFCDGITAVMHALGRVTNEVRHVPTGMPRRPVLRWAEVTDRRGSSLVIAAPGHASGPLRINPALWVSRVEGRQRSRTPLPASRSRPTWRRMTSPSTRSASGASMPGQVRLMLRHARMERGFPTTMGMLHTVAAGRCTPSSVCRLAGRCRCRRRDGFGGRAFRSGTWCSPDGSSQVPPCLLVRQDAECPCEKETPRHRVDRNTHRSQVGRRN